MSRTKAIPKARDTQYFRGVTPLWVGPGREPISSRYHDGVNALVEWIGPEWINNDVSNFFPIRHQLISSCESWASYDWDADVRWIEERRLDARYLPKAARHFQAFTDTLSKAPFRDKKRLIGTAILAELSPRAEVKLTHQEGVEGVETALAWIGERLKIRDGALARFGAVEYDGLPTRLPRREVAIALSLADQVTCFRQDGLSQGSHCLPHAPNISRNLPWKAIALLASANCKDGDEQIDEAAAQTLVTSLARKTAFVHWRG